MPSTASLFRLFNELILLLLGALLILLAITRGVSLPARPLAPVALGIVLIYWGARAGMRRAKAAPQESNLHRQVRSISLILVGLLVLLIPAAPLRDGPLLLGAAGGVLVLRGILGSVLFLRAA